jgi:F-type H+-transporting ATPase subunit b
MHFDPWTFGLQAANFLVLVWLLHRFLYRPVLGIVAARQAAAKKLTADLDEQARAAEALRHDLEAQRAAIARERDAALAEARNAAAAERKVLMAAAHSDADAVRSAAQTSFERERADLVGSLGRDATRLAVSIVRRLLQETPGRAAQDAMLRLVCEDVERLPDEAKQRICKRIAGDEHTPDVVTAAPLDLESQRSIAERLAKALGTPVQPTFSVDPNLIAGVEVRFPFTILRRAWSEDLRRIEAELIHDDGSPKLA